MQARRLVAWLILLLLITAVQGQQSERWVLLPSREAKQVATFYPTGTITGGWTPQKADLDSLEASLEQVTSLPNNWNGVINIEHPDQYYRQYVGISISRKKRIFVNAFCDLDGISNWGKHLVIVADGATCFWHALFDPETKKFSDLAINGRG